MDKFIICCYATEGTPYVDVAKENILDSLDWLLLEHEFKVVPNLGSWYKNTSYKATFAKQMLDTHTENIVLVDVDARVVQYPELFNNIPEEYNVGAHILDHKSWYRSGSDKHELLTGTLFLRNNDKTKAIVDDWVRLCASKPDVWEQKVLAEVLAIHGEQVFELPIRYCYINAMPNGAEPFVKCDDAVIVHYQASRKLKRIINSV